MGLTVTWCCQVVGVGVLVCPLFAFVAVFALFDIYIETIHMYILYIRSNKSNWANWSNLGKLFWGRPKNFMWLPPLRVGLVGL